MGRDEFKPAKEAPKGRILQHCAPTDRTSVPGCTRFWTCDRQAVAALELDVLRPSHIVARHIRTDRKPALCGILQPTRRCLCGNPPVPPPAESSSGELFESYLFGKKSLERFKQRPYAGALHFDVDSRSSPVSHLNHALGRIRCSSRKR